MKMELDTSAAVSLISYNNYLEKLSHLPLRKAVTQLKTYNGEVIMAGCSQSGRKKLYSDLTTIGGRRIWPSSVRAQLVIKAGSPLERRKNECSVHSTTGNREMV